MTNDSLPQGIYTCIFEIFAIGNSGGFRTNETLIQDVGGDSHYQLITFSHQRVSGQYTKAFIQFTSDGQPGEITFEMRIMVRNLIKILNSFSFQESLQAEKMFILTMQFLI